MHRLIAILLVLLILGLPVTALAQGSTNGVIQGQVVNGTEGGGSVAEVEVTLITYINNVMTETKTTRTDKDGKFQFDNIVTGHEYVVSAKYMGVGYYYPVGFEPGETTAYVEVGVCDATASDEAIRFRMVHTIISIEKENLLVTEVLRLVNEGDRTCVGGADGVLVFTLPEGAYDFEAPQEMAPDYQLLDNTKVVHLVPFPPGERQLVFSYRLVRPADAEFTISLNIDYPADALELMIAGENIEATVTQLAPAEPVITDAGERYIHFQGENIPRGTVIKLHLSSLSENNSLFVLPCVITAIIIVGVAAYLLKRKKRGSTND